jgi:hypothetical protein
MTRLLNCAPSRKLLPDGGNREAKCRLDPDALFAKDLRDRANAPFRFKPLGYRRHFGINE